MNELPFKARLEALINENCMENGSNTPDFILGKFLSECLSSFDFATRCRDNWYNVKLEPGRIAHVKWRHIAARIWQDQDMSDQEMDARLAEQIALMLQDKLGEKGG